MKKAKRKMLASFDLEPPKMKSSLIVGGRPAKEYDDLIQLKIEEEKLKNNPKERHQHKEIPPFGK